MTLADLLDPLVLLARGAKPDMEVGSLHTELLSEIGNFHTGVTGGFKSREDFGSQITTGGALGGLLRSLAGFGGRATRLPLGRPNGLTRDDAGHMGLDALDFFKKGFFLIHKGGKLIEGRGGEG